MKNLRLAAIIAFIAVALNTTSFAASFLNLPTVFTVDQYAKENGRTEEEVLKLVVESAKEYEATEKPEVVEVVEAPKAPVTVEETRNYGTLGGYRNIALPAIWSR